ncbi:23145_t:CDS:2, partial [Gigaspora margarita]
VTKTSSEIENSSESSGSEEETKSEYEKEELEDHCSDFQKIKVGSLTTQRSNWDKVKENRNFFLKVEEDPLQKLDIEILEDENYYHIEELFTEYNELFAWTF